MQSLLLSLVDDSYMKVDGCFYATIITIIISMNKRLLQFPVKTGVLYNCL